MQEVVYGDAEGVEIIEDTILENSRWSILHMVIFKFENKFYSSTYSVGATEQQDWSPYEYDGDGNGEILCTEVQQVERMVKVWEPIG